MKFKYQIALAALATPLFLSGCSALMTTTNTVAETLQTTTNGITHVSASSSGGSEAAAPASVNQFVRSQISAIRRQAAAGHGEDLVALAQLMHAPDSSAFGHWMQANYKPLFQNLQTPEQLVTRINTLRG